MDTRFIKIEPEIPESGLEIVIPCGRIEAGVVFTVRGGSACLYHVDESRIAGVCVLVKGVFRILVNEVKEIGKRLTHQILMGLRCFRSMQLCLTNGGGLRL